MTRRILGLAIMLGACGSSQTTDDPVDSIAALGTRHAMSGSKAPAQPRFENRAAVRYHMARHFDDLRAVERLLVANKLEDAKTRAFLLTIPSSDPGMAPWESQSMHVTAAAVELTKAPTIATACRTEARLAKACAECHTRVPKPPAFAKLPSLPADEGTVESKMLRHQWAVDRLWDGMIGASDAAWSAALDVLASTPAPWESADDVAGHAKHLRQLANDARDKQGTETLDGRAAAYGEIMIACAACHATLPARQY